MSFNIWMGAITKGPANILVENSDVFDGCVFTVDSRTDKEEINNLNKIGHTIIRDFNQAHDWRANDWLHSGHIKRGDWVVILDTLDLLNDKFKSQLRENIEYWDKNGIRTVYLDRPFIFKFTGHEFFQSSPHWSLRSFGPIVNLSQIEGYIKENYLINNRDINVSGIDHPIKYFIEYKRSNHTELLYRQFSDEIWQKHENYRVWLQLFVEEKLGFECNVANMITYLTAGIMAKNLPNEVIEFIEAEVSMQDLVRYYILKHDFLGEIAQNRFNWSFKKFYLSGIEHQSKDDGFVGLFNQYKIRKGEKLE